MIFFLLMFYGISSAVFHIHAHTHIHFTHLHKGYNTPSILAASTHKHKHYIITHIHEGCKLMAYTYTVHMYNIYSGLHSCYLVLEVDVSWGGCRTAAPSTGLVTAGITATSRPTTNGARLILRLLRDDVYNHVVLFLRGLSNGEGVLLLLLLQRRCVATPLPSSFPWGRRRSVLDGGGTKFYQSREQACLLALELHLQLILFFLFLLQRLQNKNKKFALVRDLLYTYSGAPQWDRVFVRGVHYSGCTCIYYIQTCVCVCVCK